jgi:hypothetical protein
VWDSSISPVDKLHDRWAKCSFGGDVYRLSRISNTVLGPTKNVISISCIVTMEFDSSCLHLLNEIRLPRPSIDCGLSASNAVAWETCTSPLSFQPPSSQIAFRDDLEYSLAIK